MDSSGRQSMLEMYVFETIQMIEQLEELLIETEQSGKITADALNEVFRIMHTIKGSSAMMEYDQIASLAHALEDLFDVLRNNPGMDVDAPLLIDYVLQSADFFKEEISKAEAGQSPDGDAGLRIEQIKEFHAVITDTTTAAAQPDAFYARLLFDDGCEMENMHAFAVAHNLESHVEALRYFPEDILENEASAAVIRKQGFELYMTSFETEEDLRVLLDQSLFVNHIEFRQLDRIPEELGPDNAADRTDALIEIEPFPSDESLIDAQTQAPAGKPVREPGSNARSQSVISVHIKKLDALLDLVGEIVISEAMVSRNPELDGLELEGFHKAAHQLNKLTNELQDIVMSIRMVPVAATFQKMQRIVRDMTRKLDKHVNLNLSGEETEIDKSIIDLLADPMMHLLRNSLDHGIESPEIRRAAGKPEVGTITIEARSAGRDVWITVSDDGKGLDPQALLRKAIEKDLLDRPASEYSEKEIFSFILLPGFSTKEQISEYSGRGVGMDVVRDSIEKIGGSLNIDSKPGQGTSFIIRIPLTLAIIDGMLLSIGQTSFVLPINAIRESFRPTRDQIIVDSENNEMLMIRGSCINVMRLHEQFVIDTQVKQLEDGILIIVEDDDRTACLFADALIGEQQAVVKPLPAYLKKTGGLAGCTILGDGSISLILDVSGMFGLK